MKVYADKEIWFATGSQHLYGPETLAQVAEQSQAIARMLDEADVVPARIVWKPVLTDSDAIRRLALEASSSDACIGVIAWMHTFSPAKMWIAGLEALRKPLLHLHTQANVELPWDTIDFDFMNLNQAAHGDREFGYIATRLGVPRKTVVGHASSPEVQQKVATWARAGPRGGGPPPAGRPRTTCAWPGSATTCATSRSPRVTRPRPRSGSGSR
jgi:L-arabinose isomerase